MKRIITLITIVIYVIGFVYFTVFPYVSMSEIEKTNKVVTPMLGQLMETKYFRIIRLNLHQQCPLNLFAKICKSKSCTVCRCDDKDIPSNWMKTDRIQSIHSNQDLWEQQGGMDIIHVEDQQQLLSQGEYFDVHKNIESYTNYNGSYIWKLIYQQNCIHQPIEDISQMCAEQRVLYNIISGLHTSISTHLSKYYKNVTTTNAGWADLRNEQNAQFYFNELEYQRRVLQHPDRVANLFLVYRLLIKAIQQVSPNLMGSNFTIQSDNIAEDLKASQLLKALLVEINQHKEEFADRQLTSLLTISKTKLEQYRRYFYNISNILNCIQCQKCRLFGKMQTYGIGTALKILLGDKHTFRRNQIVALFNVFSKVSISVDIYNEAMHRQRTDKSKRIDWEFIQIYAIIGLSISVCLFMLFKIDLNQKIKKKFKHVFPPKSIDPTNSSSAEGSKTA